MKIGQFIRHYLDNIFAYCEKEDHEELERLMNSAYSKETFDINFPFFQKIVDIPPELSKRYWTNTYLVRGKSIRVTSQWFDSHVSNSRALFGQYLFMKHLATKEELGSLPELLSREKPQKGSSQIRRTRTNSRYRGNAIGNAQNLMVRNILSNLGRESFSDKDWLETKAYFNNRCAYCGKDGELVMEHAIPINRTAMGEHRLGNLVPSCSNCNDRKGDKDFRQFLGQDENHIHRIEAYMDSRNYVPIGDNDQVQKILEMAYEEVGLVADRYIQVLDTLFPK